MNQTHQLFPFQRQLVSMMSKGVKAGQQLTVINSGRGQGKSFMSIQWRKSKILTDEQLAPSKAAWHQGGKPFKWFVECSTWFRCSCAGDFIEQTEWLATHGTAGTDWRVRVASNWEDFGSRTTMREWFIRDQRIAYLFTLRFGSGLSEGVDF